MKQPCSDNEALLLNLAINYLRNPSINPYEGISVTVPALCCIRCVTTGSIPVEQLQNLIHWNHLQLYRSVIKAQHKGWTDFLERHRHVLITFGMKGQRRVRWAGHRNWVVADIHAHQQKEEMRIHIRNMLCLFLRQWQGEMKPRAPFFTRHGALVQTIDDFIYSYPHLPGNRVNADGQLMFPLPPRGDIVRFVRKHRHLFLYDDNTYQFPRWFHLWLNGTSKMFQMLGRHRR